jgi:hypothetical protein
MHLSHLDEFKNFIAVAIGLLHSQPFTNSHFHFFIIVESATSQVLLTRVPFVAFYLYQVLPSTEKQNA